MISNNSQIKVGIGVLVFKDGKVLLCRRKGSHGAGEFGGPGGHLEFGESFEECARRECREEAGIEIKNIRFLCVSNILRYSNQYIDIGLIADWKSGEPTVKEPQKAESWEWYDVDKLPRPLFCAEENYLKALKTGKRFFDK